MPLYFKLLAISGRKVFRVEAEPSRLETSVRKTLPLVKCLALSQWVRQLKSITNDLYLIMKLTMLGVLIRDPKCRLTRKPWEF